jgi:hypothetical protein
MEREKEQGRSGQTLVTITLGWRKQWARADEMEAQRGARPSLKKPVLQKTLRPEPRDWIYHRLPFENPASHRKANCRVDKMHRSHIHPQSESTSLIL